MGKVKIFCLLVILILAATAFLLSGNASTETDDVIKKQPKVTFQGYDEYYTMKIQHINYYPDDGSDFLWKNMESEEHATKLSDDQFVDGKALIDLPFGFQLFDLIVTRVAVTKEGTILSADPSVKWTIAPLNAKFGMSSSTISYLFKDKNLYVQWNNFRFNHEIFKEHDFRFQVRLGDRGQIDFFYKKVPFDLKYLPYYLCDCLGDKFGVVYSHQEEFKVPPYHETYELGFFLDSKKYNPYYKANEIKKGTVIRFFPADQCMFRKNCYDCTTTEFKIKPNQTARCLWCPAIEKCSSTRDISRNIWRENKCNDEHFNRPGHCYITFLGFEGASIFYHALSVLIPRILAIGVIYLIILAVLKYITFIGFEGASIFYYVLSSLIPRILAIGVIYLIILAVLEYITFIGFEEASIFYRVLSFLKPRILAFGVIYSIVFLIVYLIIFVVHKYYGKVVCCINQCKSVCFGNDDVPA